MNRTIFALLLSALLFVPLSVATGQDGSVTVPLCNGALHGQFAETGPNGVTYATWHPQIMVYTEGGVRKVCHWDHEHGSNPALAVPGNSKNFQNSGWPLFEYTASRMGMTEGHNGFKVAVMDVINATDGKLVRLMIVYHMGTSNAAKAACVQYHTVDVKVVDPAVLVVNPGAASTVSGQPAYAYKVLADLHLMADFGQSQTNQAHRPLTPPNCLDNATRPVSGIRLFPSLDDGPVGYEPWRAANGANVFGFNFANWTVNAPGAQTFCVDTACATNYRNPGATGQYRFIGFARPGGPTSPYIFGLTADGPRGEFYTDAHGMAMLNATDSGAVRQYIEPGWTFTVDGVTCNPFGREMLYLCGTNAWHDQGAYDINPFVTGDN